MLKRKHGRRYENIQANEGENLLKRHLKKWTQYTRVNGLSGLKWYVFFPNSMDLYI
jgi:hypothetical protein